MSIVETLNSAHIKRGVACLDIWVDKHFDQLRGKPIPDRVFYTASAIGDNSLVWLVLGAARGLRSTADHKAAMRLATGVVGESILVNIGIKSLFRRKRPTGNVIRPHRLRQPRTSSFPSGHATSAFAAAILLSEDDSLWPFYYGLATVVAASRIHVRIHHASDVIAGSALGCALGLLGRRLFPFH